MGEERGLEEKEFQLERRRQGQRGPKPREGGKRERENWLARRLGTTDCRPGARCLGTTDCRPGTASTLQLAIFLKRNGPGTLKIGSLTLLKYINSGNKRRAKEVTFGAHLYDGLL